MGLLDDFPESHMLISTRSSETEFETNSTVLFEPRPNTGRESLRMFLSSANLDNVAISLYETIQGTCRYIKSVRSGATRQLL